MCHPSEHVCFLNLRNCNAQVEFGNDLCLSEFLFVKSLSNLKCSAILFHQENKNNKY